MGGAGGGEVGEGGGLGGFGGGVIVFERVIGRIVGFGA